VPVTSLTVLLRADVKTVQATVTAGTRTQGALSEAGPPGITQWHDATMPLPVGPSHGAFRLVSECSAPASAGGSLSKLPRT
jgi:hypothetical protein